MSQPVDTLQESDLSDGWDAQGRLDFSTLYDRYAPALLGVITRIVADKAEAVGLLEKTFIKVRSELSLVRPGQQPLFSWMFGIARCTALDRLSERTQIPTPVFQITSTGQVIVQPTARVTLSSGLHPESTGVQLKELLDSVLFNNCTPEEAAVKVGIPVEMARQQLRLAMQQLRSQSK